MASTDQSPGVTTSREGEQPPGQSLSIGQQMLDKGAQLMQSLKPVKEISQHACTFSIYSHDMTRQIETHHFCTRLNQDFLQCAVYDTDDAHGRLIGVEYIVSTKLFQSLPPEEQKLWHSHAHEVKSGLRVYPRVPELVARPELENIADTYGKFWCTWQVDRGDKLPMGAPALMVSPQGVNLGLIKQELIDKRDKRYDISTEKIMAGRLDIPEPEWISPVADYWKHQSKGFAIDIEETDMKQRAPFP